MKTIRSRVVFIGLILVLTTAHPAGADTSGRLDDDDSRGPLDIAAIEHGHAGTSDAKLLAHTVLTYEAWDNDIMENGGVFVFLFSPDSDSNVERTLLITGEAGVLSGEMRTRGGKFVGTPTVMRPNPQSVRITFPKPWLGKGVANGYGWQVYSHFETQNPPCSGEEAGCRDYAPLRNGFLIHRL